MPRKATPPPIGLVLVRATVGAVLLLRGWRWIHEGSFDGDAVRRLIDSALTRCGSIAEWWGREVLLSNPDAIGFLCEWLALVGGLLFLVGALTRPLGVLLAFFLANAWFFGAEQHGPLFLLLLVCCLACSISRAGHRFGLDSALEGHAPRWLTWSTQKKSFLD
jgi:uncharacterized membrane protein YphA (DoxX/SURF4 family)